VRRFSSSPAVNGPALDAGFGLHHLQEPARHALAKKAYNVCENMPQRDGYRFEQDITVQLSHTEDAKLLKSAQLLLDRNELLPL
jgi:hypothetical protein